LALSNKEPKRFARILYKEIKIINSNSGKKKFVRWQEGTLEEYLLNLEKRYEESHGKVDAFLHVAASSVCSILKFYKD
jgi:hypothetical protein